MRSFIPAVFGFGRNFLRFCGFSDFLRGFRFLIGPYGPLESELVFNKNSTKTIRLSALDFYEAIADSVLTS